MVFVGFPRMLCRLKYFLDLSLYWEILGELPVGADKGFVMKSCLAIFDISGIFLFDQEIIGRLVS